MIEDTVQFYIIKRRNTFVDKGYEWALNARIGSHDTGWTICTFDLKPTENQIKNTKEIIMRSFEYYHLHLRIPPFKMKDTSDEIREKYALR